jgi:hypothetical protein
MLVIPSDDDGAHMEFTLCPLDPLGIELLASMLLPAWQMVSLIDNDGGGKLYEDEQKCHTMNI